MNELLKLAGYKYLTHIPLQFCDDYFITVKNDKQEIWSYLPNAYFLGLQQYLSQYQQLATNSWNNQQSSLHKAQQQAAQYTWNNQSSLGQQNVTNSSQMSRSSLPPVKKKPWWKLYE